MRNRMTDKYRSASGMFQEKNVAGDAMHKRKQRRILRGVSASLGCVLAAFMFFTLMKPAITLEKNAGMEPELVCALEEHVHTDACLGYDHEETEPVYGTNRELVCSFVPHVHDEACLDENGMLICGLSDVYYHVHDEYCFDHGTLVCTLTERAREEELEQVQVLVCEKEESQGHVHSQDCYTCMYFTDEDPICGMEESGAHVHTEECFGLIQICELDHEHTDACFAEGLICPLAVGESHVHTLECYPSIQVLICGLEETEGHVHTADCYVMETREKEEHVHTEACLENGVYICGQTEVWSHQHTAECWQETTILISGGHIHSEECLKVLICGKEEHVHNEACWKGKAEEIEKLLAVPEQKPVADGEDAWNGQGLTEVSGTLETDASGMDDLVSEEPSDDLFTDGEYTVFEEVYTRSEDESTLVEEEPEDETDSGLIEEEVPVEEDGVSTDGNTVYEAETLSSEMPGESASDASMISGADQEMQVPALNGDEENADENPESADDAATVPEAQSGEAEPVQEGAQDPAQFGNVHFIQEYTLLDDGSIFVTLGPDDGILASDILAFAGIYADEVLIESDIPFLEIGKDYFACRFAFDEGTVTLTAGDLELTVLCRYAAAPEAQPDDSQQDAENGDLTDDCTETASVNPEGNENGEAGAQSPETAPSDSENQFADTVFVDTFTRLEDGSFEVKLGKDAGIRVQDVLNLAGIVADQVQIASDIPFLEINEDTVVCRFAYEEGTVVLTAGETEIRMHCLFAAEEEGEAVKGDEPGADIAASEREENEIEFFPGTEERVEQPEENAADASGEDAAAGSETLTAVEQIGENLYAVKIHLNESLTAQNLLKALGLNAAEVTLSTDAEALSVEEDWIKCVSAFEEGTVILSADGQELTIVCRFDAGNLSNDTDAVEEGLDEGTDVAAGSEGNGSAEETDPEGLNADADTKEMANGEDGDPAADGKESAEDADAEEVTDKEETLDSGAVEDGQDAAADSDPEDEEKKADENADAEDLNDHADTGDAEAESVRFVQMFETLDEHTFAVELSVNDGVYVRDLPGLEEVEAISISPEIEAIEAAEDRFICRGAFEEGRVILTVDEVEITVICRFAEEEASGNTGTQTEENESSETQDPEAVQFVQVFQAVDEHTYAVELGLNDGVQIRDIPGLEAAEAVNILTEIEAIEVGEDCFICRGAFEEGDVVVSSGDLTIRLICRFAEKHTASEEDDHTGDTEPEDAAADTDADTDADPAGGISVTGEGAEHVQAMLQPEGSDAVIEQVRTAIQGLQPETEAQTSTEIWRVFSLAMDEALESPVEVFVPLDIVLQEMLPEGAELISVNWQLYQVSVESGEILPVSDFIIQGDETSADRLIFGTDIPGVWTVRCSLAYAAVHETYDLVLDLSGFEADPEADETELGISVVTGERVAEEKEQEMDFAASDGEKHEAEVAEGDEAAAAPDAESVKEAKADEGTQPFDLGLSIDFAKLMHFLAEYPEADFHGIRALSEGIPAEKLNPETLAEESSDGHVSYDSGILRIWDNGTVQIRGQQISLHVHIQGYETPGTQKGTFEYTFGGEKTADMQEIFAVSGLSDHFHPVRYAYEVSDPEKVTLTWDGESWKVQANDWFEDVTLSIRRAWYSAAIHLRNPEPDMPAGTVISSQDGRVSMTLLDDIQMPADTEIFAMPSDGGDLPEQVTEAFAGYSDLNAAWLDIAFGDVREIHAALTLHGFIDVPEALRGYVSEIKAMVLRADEYGLSILDAKSDGTDIVFETDRLSRFCVVWAVNYVWNVDGMSYAWTLTDSGYDSLGSMVESLGMVKASVPADSGEQTAETGNAEENGGDVSANAEAGDAGQATTEAEGTEGVNPSSVSEVVRKFLDHVQNVSWANGEIGWSGKADAETTVGQIREAFGLERIWPAGISDEQIAEMDAQSVSEGDWVILRLVPFAGEEMLTIAMDNGETFTVSMTDAIIPQTVVLSAKGDTYGIQVSCDPEAGIPETAELVVREIVEEDAAYTEYMDMAYAHVNGDEKQNTDMAEGEADGENGYAARQEIRYARFFDIQIWDGGEKIDPKAPVNVQIRLSDAPTDAEHLPEVIHFAKNGPETLKASAKAAEAEAPSVEASPMLLMKSTGKKLAKAASVPAATEEPTVIEFSASGFSVYSVVYTVDFHYEVNGKEFEFSIPGGGFASFYKIVEVLGIGEQGTQSGSGDENATENSEIEYGNSENTDENAVHNVVEETGVEEIDANGSNYEESISLNNVEVSEVTKKFVADVASVEFSSPELVWVVKVDETTTVGGLKEANGLEVQYSAELTEEQIAEINSSTVEAGDWALISVLPFDTEESLTVTMKNGDQFVVRVTDYQNVNDTNYFNNNSTFVIWATGNDGKSYALRTDGTTAEINTTDYNDPNYVDKLGAEYQWKITYGFNSGVDRYFIRPVTDLTKNLYLAGNGHYVAPGGSLIQNEDCGIRIYHTDSDNTWKLEGWNWISLNLGYNTHLFEGNNDYYSQINLSRQQGLPEYEFTVRTEDIRRGFANGQDKDGIAQSGVREYDTKTNYVQDGPKTNLYPITAVPATDDHGNQKYLFDYWDLDGERLSLGETIGVGELTIPRNKSVLTAHFKKNPDYVVPDEEKDGHSIDKQAMDDWLAWLKDPDRVTPFEVGDCGKTAEVYDYENRIYRVDITAKSNLPSFVGDIDLGFMLDVSSSMKFPAKLNPVEGLEEVDINHINDNSTNQAWLTRGTTYYLISDKGSTATVYEIRWGNWVYNSMGQTRTGWGYKDASKDDNNMRYIVNSSAWSGGEVGEIYPIYVDGDPGHTRSYYLETSITNTINELNEILAALSVAANTGQEPKVKVAWNTFHKRVTDPHHDFTSVEGLSISPTYSYSGGTSADLAMLDAAGIQRNDPSGADAAGRLYNWHSGITYSSTDGFHWEDNAAKYAVLITDGAPQRNGNDVDAKLVTDAADFLKNGADGIAGTDDDIKLITVGLSMGDVKKGSVRLYDISSLDEEGDPLFYKAITGDELQYALYQMLQHTMGTALVQSDISDTINEAFYPVDKITGAPLNPGNVINLDGEKIGDSVGNLTDEQKKAGYGTIGWDNTKGLYTVQWTDQNVSGDGWHGAVYEKAKEDFIGGNTVRTNDGEAVIQAKSYKPNADAAPIALKDAIVNGPGRIPLETPRVNVNELDFLKNDTQWTVYLGTELKEADLKEQLKKLYENIKIVQVVTKNHGTDTDDDGLIDKVNGNKDTAYYFTMQESALDKLDPKPGATPETMYLKDVIKKINGGNDLTSEQWNTLITLSDEEGDANTGIEFPYALYGQDCPGTITLKLTKDHALEDHVTDTVGSPVETYALEAVFSPMYLHIPAGQSGTDPWEYHTGGFGLSTCGLAAGKDDSTSTHVINVYAKTIEVEKHKPAENDTTTLLTDKAATFSLYRKWKSGDDASEKVSLEGYTLDNTVLSTPASDSDYYFLVETKQTSNGVAKFTADLSADDDPYYLVETQAPEGYQHNKVIQTITVTPGPNTTTTITTPPVTTTIEGAITTAMPYNWTQGVRFYFDGDETPAVYVDGSGTQIVPVTGKGARTYVLPTDADGYFKTSVLNTPLASMQLKKQVTINDFDPEHSAVTDKTVADGTYVINIDGKEGTATAGKSYTVKITITNGSAASATIKDNTVTDATDTPATLTNGVLTIPDLIPGEYTVTEAVDSKTVLTAINSTDDGAVADLDNRRITITLDGTAGSIQLVTLINNYADNHETDIAHVSVRKTFAGLKPGMKLPENFNVTVKVTATIDGTQQVFNYTLRGESDTTDGINWNQSVNADGDVVWDWRIAIHGLTPSAQVEVQEVNYTKPGYDVTTSANPGGAGATSYTGTVSSSTVVSGTAAVITQQNSLVFPLTDNGSTATIFVARIVPSQTSLVISKNKLNLSEKAALEAQLHSMSNAGDWYNNTVPLYYSFEDAANHKITVRNRSEVTYSETTPGDPSTGQIRFDKKCQWDMVATVTMTYVEGRPADFNFVNNYVERGVGIDIVKVDNNQRTTTLPGAEFTLTKLDESTTPGHIRYKMIPGTSNYEVRVTSDPTGNDGTTTFDSNLTSGYYEIEETKLPAGYISTGEEKFYIKIEDGVAKKLIVSDDSEKAITEWETLTTSNQSDLIQFTLGSADDPATAGTNETTNTLFSIGNEPGAALPNTGGPGTNMLYLFGIMLTGLAGAGLMMRRRRKAS